MSTQDYLIRAARDITDRALTGYSDAAAYYTIAPQRRKQFLEMMGVAELPPPEQRLPLNVQVTGVVERPHYRIEKLHYQSLPQLYVTANLYIPRNLTVPAPGVLYACGHHPQQKVHYQAHPRRFAELGFVCLIVETIALGEVNGNHHGCFYEGWFHWYSRGYTPAGVEMWSGIRGLDLLAQRPEVDATRLGVTGISGGGATTWAVAAADERVRVAAPVCGTGTLASHLADRTIDTHCDCMWWINNYGWDLADVGGLIAPRPLLIASADHDALYTIESIREVHAQLERLYTTLGVPENLRLVETPGPHSYHQRSRTAIFSWFIKHLQGKEIAPEQVGDIDEGKAKQESEETLRVFVNGSPQPNRALTIQDDFCIPAPAPHIEDATTLKETRQQVIAALRAKTFAAFPLTPEPLHLEVQAEATTGDTISHSFTFTSEAGVQLQGQLSLKPPTTQPTPAVIALCLPDEPLNTAAEFIAPMNATGTKIVVETRRLNDAVLEKTRRGLWKALDKKKDDKLQWHLRRAAAWTGRTLASMRVYDTLRALEAARALPQIDAAQITLVARGEMAAVALYAALLDGQIETLILQDPPATQNAPSQPDGNGPAIEMLTCLQITDLPYVAGLLYPTELVFVGNCPATYQWAEQLYTTLGAASRFGRIENLAQWQPL